ncbi:Nitroreductase family [Serratia entomophila]|jgi:nitroreductase|uniref:Nitroreductase n=1 Tax=Serratia entomophila TaxID=42906 RepID=A0ABY5CPY5_9GAMM|nr:nitroreductase [Serratia entomophila]UIW17182.1 nitroreductase [Serratia entomophila]USU99736.1 nitroreductase [Serratia entomophila]CAI0693728.1 Nitroreductase family [Serratia entomophila]CAI0694190.1 Nitroreductase family [Serratia entomophila]CAI0694425.1 Nitroreductase family [Serratia entomophila]
MNSRVLSFADTVSQRFSPRAFLPASLTEGQLNEVLQDAQCAPSNCNTQPWHVHIVSGKKREALSNTLIENDNLGLAKPDFTFDYADYYGDYFERSQEQTRIYYESLGVRREDQEKRREIYLRNFKFFNAPHVAFLFMPSFGDNVRVASDIGMYAQNFLLSLTARGYAGIPQTLLGFHADTVREALGVSAEFRLLFGISFGYADPQAPTHSVRVGRLPVEKSVVLHN